MSNLPEVASSAKTHRCYTIRSWADRSSPVGSKRKTLPLRTAAHSKVMLPSYLSSNLFRFTLISLPLSLPPLTPGHRATIVLFLCVLAKWALLCTINLHNSTAVSTSLYFLLFHQVLCFKLHPIAMCVSVTWITALSALPGTDATPSGTGREPGALASRRGPAGSGLSSSPARGCRPAVPAGLSPHHPTPCCPRTSSSFLVSARSKRWKRRVHCQFLPNLPEPCLVGERQEKHQWH